MVSLSPLCGRLVGIKVDTAGLQKFFLEQVATTQATPYKDNNWEYDGWSVTSRSGEVDDNIRRSKKGEDKFFGTPPQTATVPTELCFGAAEEILNTLTDRGFDHFRARFLRLKSASYNMAFHMDRSGLGK